MQNKLKECVLFKTQHVNDCGQIHKMIGVKKTD